MQYAQQPPPAPPYEQRSRQEQQRPHGFGAFGPPGGAPLQPRPLSMGAPGFPRDRPPAETAGATAGPRPGFRAAQQANALLQPPARPNPLLQRAAAESAAAAAPPLREEPVHDDARTITPEPEDADPMLVRVGEARAIAVSDGGAMTWYWIRGPDADGFCSIAKASGRNPRGPDWSTASTVHARDAMTMLGMASVGKTIARAAGSAMAMTVSPMPTAHRPMAAAHLDDTRSQQLMALQQGGGVRVSGGLAGSVDAPTLRRGPPLPASVLEVGGAVMLAELADAGGRAPTEVRTVHGLTDQLAPTAGRSHHSGAAPAPTLAPAPTSTGSAEFVLMD